MATDSFDYAAGVLSTRPSTIWNATAGSAEMAADGTGRVTANVTLDFAANLYNTTLATDHFAEVSYQFAASAGGSEIGCVVRATPVVRTGYYAIITSDGSGLHLYKITGTGALDFTEIGSAPWAFVPSATGTIRLVAAGTTISVFHNGTSVISVTDASYSGTSVGLASYLTDPGVVFATAWRGDVGDGAVVTISGVVAVTEATDTPLIVGSFTAAGSVSGVVAGIEADDVVALVGTFTAPTTFTGIFAATEVADVAALVATFTAAAISTVPYPAAVSGRKLLDQNGRLIQMRALSSWGMAQNLSNADITNALEDLAGAGFNSLPVVMDGGNNYGGSWEQWQNSVTNQPFYTGTPYQSTLGPAWATHIAHLMDETERLGLFVIATNYANGPVGSAGAMVAAGTANCRTTGQRWATFLAPWTHWMLELVSDEGSSPDSMYEAFCQGIKDIRPGVLVVAEPNGNELTSNRWPTGSFTYFTPIQCMYYTGYSGPATVTNARAAYADTTLPTVDIEPTYIGAPHMDGGTGGRNPQLRQAFHAPIIEGFVGRNSGHEDWWSFGAPDVGWTNGDTWPTAMACVQIGWYTAGWPIWDLCNTPGWAPTLSFITTGQGSGDTIAAQGTDGAKAIAFFPTSRSVTVDTTIIAGTGNVRLRWFDPMTGGYATIAASEAQNAARSISYPANHGDGSSDYVLVVESIDAAGTIAAVEATDVAAIVGTFTAAPGTVVGTIATTEATDIAVIVGTIAVGPLTGVIAVTEAGDVPVIVGFIPGAPTEPSGPLIVSVQAWPPPLTVEVTQ